MLQRCLHLVGSKWSKQWSKWSFTYCNCRIVWYIITITEIAKYHIQSWCRKTETVFFFLLNLLQLFSFQNLFLQCRNNSNFPCMTAYLNALRWSLRWNLHIYNVICIAFNATAVPHVEFTPHPAETMEEKPPYYHSAIKETTQNGKFFVEMPRFMRDSKDKRFMKRKATSLKTSCFLRILGS